MTPLLRVSALVCRSRLARLGVLGAATLPLSVACTEDLSAERARVAELMGAHQTLMTEAEGIRAAAKKRLAALPTSSPQARADLDAAVVVLDAAVVDYDKERQRAQRALDGLLAQGKALPVVRAINDERLNLDDAHQRVIDAHIAVQRATEIVVNEVAAARATQRAQNELETKRARTIQRAHASGGELRFDIFFNAKGLDTEASSKGLQELFNFLVFCKDLKVDVVVGSVSDKAGKAQATTLKDYFVKRGVPAARFKTLLGQVSKDVTIRVVKPCAPPPDHPD